MPFRVYFNRHEDAPQVWSVDQGSLTSEINVQGVVANVLLISRYRPDAVYPEPKAWLECEHCRLTIDSGTAYLEPL